MPHASVLRVGIFGVSSRIGEGQTETQWPELQKLVAQVAGINAHLAVIGGIAARVAILMLEEYEARTMAAMKAAGRTFGVSQPLAPVRLARNADLSTVRPVSIRTSARCLHIFFAS